MPNTEKLVNIAGLNRQISLMKDWVVNASGKVNSPVDGSQGEGKILQYNQDGTTSWVDTAGVPTEDVQDAVDAYFEAHPEVIGTGNVEWEHLHEDVQDKITKAHSNIAPIEETTAAAIKHNKGDYFILNTTLHPNTLYQATSNIIANETIIPGTNCSEAKLSNEITDLKSALTLTESAIQEGIEYQVNYVRNSFDGIYENYIYSTEDGTRRSANPKNVASVNLIDVTDGDVVTFANMPKAGILLYYGDNGYISYAIIPAEGKTFTISNGATKIRFEITFSVNTPATEAQTVVVLVNAQESSKSIETRLLADVSRIDQNTTVYKELSSGTDYTIITGAYKNSNSYPPAVDTSTLFNATDMTVSAGEKYKLCIYAFGTVYSKYSFYGSSSSDTYHSSAAATSKVYTEIEVTIPANVTHMTVNWAAGDAYKPHIYKAISVATVINDLRTEIAGLNSKAVSYSISGGIVTLTAPNGLEITFGKRGVNDLPDFRTIKDGSTTLYNNATDFHGPYKVGAMSNADGDDVENHTFTGGAHGYNGNGTGSATGRNLSLTYYADGIAKTNGDSGYANQFEIVWVNRIQGYNTRKSDGTGREILEEIHRMTYDGVAFVSVVEIMPLENVTVEQYYGYQAALNSTYYPNIIFTGGSNRGEYRVSDNPSSGNATPNKMTGFGTTYSISVEVDRTYDIGKGTYYNSTKGMFVAGSKMYTYLISNAELSADNYYEARARYCFK